MSLNKINGIAPSQNKDSQVKDSKKSKLDRAGEEAIFPNLTVFTNEKVSEFMRGMDEKETTYDLFDDKTGELSTELNKWEEAYLEAEYNSDFKHGTKYIEKENTGYDTTEFRYDSDADGKFETQIKFYGTGNTQYTIDNGEVTMSYGQELYNKRNKKSPWGDIVSFERKDEQGGISGYKEIENPEENKNRVSFYSKSESNYQTESETIIEYDKRGQVKRHFSPAKRDNADN